ncbi:MAG: glycoside hydrolase family 28 protein, partial [Faecalibacterium prausnitzii]
MIGVNIHVGDDCIAMKASKVFLGMKLKKSCEHTVIRNCLLDKGHGGIVIGSEMSGGVEGYGGHPVPDGPHRPRPARQDPPRPRQHRRHRRAGVPQRGDAGRQGTFVINMFYFCDPDGHGPYVQCREPMPVDEYTPKLGSLTMENIVATSAVRA